MSHLTSLRVVTTDYFKSSCYNKGDLIISSGTVNGHTFDQIIQMMMTCYFYCFPPWQCIGLWVNIFQIQSTCDSCNNVCK